MLIYNLNHYKTILTNTKPVCDIHTVVVVSCTARNCWIYKKNTPNYIVLDNINN